MARGMNCRSCAIDSSSVTALRIRCSKTVPHASQLRRPSVIVSSLIRSMKSVIAQPSFSPRLVTLLAVIALLVPGAPARSASILHRCRGLLVPHAERDGDRVLTSNLFHDENRRPRGPVHDVLPRRPSQIALQISSIRATWPLSPSPPSRCATSCTSVASVSLRSASLFFAR